MKQYILDLRQSLITGGYFMFTFANVDVAMKVIAFVIATGYTARRWYLMEKTKRMKLNNSGYLLITEFEGFSAKPYLCSAKIPTIGFGNTYYPDGKRVTMLDKEVNKVQAFEMFKYIADKFASTVSKLVTSPLNQNQFNALVSLAYNIGTGNFASSTLLKKVNKNHNDTSIELEFKKWNKVNKKEVAGLTRRRLYESKVYFS